MTDRYFRVFFVDKNGKPDVIYGVGDLVTSNYDALRIVERDFHTDYKGRPKSVTYTVEEVS